MLKTSRVSDASLSALLAVPKLTKRDTTGECRRKGRQTECAGYEQRGYRITIYCPQPRIPFGIFPCDEVADLPHFACERGGT